jgi:hypothetical protein
VGWILAALQRYATYTASLLAAACLSAWVFANPEITDVSGVVFEGNTLTLSGSEFFGNWKIADGNGVDAAAFVTNDHARSGDKTWVVEPAYNGSLRYDYGSEIPENTPIFISWWVRFEASNDVGQWKMFRLSHHNDIQDSGTEAVMFNWFGGNGDQFIIRPDRCPQGNNAISFYGGKYPSEKGKWYRVDQYIHTSSQGAKDGYSETTLLGESINLSEWSSSSDVDPKYPDVMTYNATDRYRWFIWQNYRGSGLNNLKVWLDDIYIQVGSVARVELGNADTFGASNIREIQRVKAWTENSIEIELNTGSFVDGQVAWLYIVNEYGQVSSGYKVQISGEIIDDGCSGYRKPAVHR